MEPTDSMAPACLVSVKLVIHCVGDTGGIKQPVFSPGEQPSIWSGTRSAEQFYELYVHYPTSMCAIPGRRDADVMPDDNTEDDRSTVDHRDRAGASLWWGRRSAHQTNTTKEKATWQAGAVQLVLIG